MIPHEVASSGSLIGDQISENSFFFEELVNFIANAVVQMQLQNGARKC